MLPLPTYDHVLQLPRSVRMIVPAEFADHNGHMNVRHYLALQDDAGFSYFTGFGFGDAYIAREHRGFFDLEQHLCYYAEVLVGQTVAIHTRVLGRSAKAVHVMSFMVNETTERVANTFEVTMAHVDLEARRTVPFEGATASALDRQIAADATVTWAAPVCGAMGVR